MASFLGDSNLLISLSGGDVASNELYYHKKCYVSFRDKYNSKKAKENSGRNSSDSVLQAVSQAKVIEFMYQTESECPGTMFQVKSLEEKYINLLKCHNIQCESNVTRFADTLLSLIDGLEKRIINNKVMVYFGTIVDNFLSEHVIQPSMYLKSLRHVVNCTRKSMRMSFLNNFASHHRVFNGIT